MVPQYCILNVLVSSSLWQGMDRLGHAGSTVEQHFFSVDPSLVLVHQCLSLFQPIKAITGIGAIKPGDLFEGLVYSASLLIFMLLHLFCLLSFVLFLLSFFSFLLSVSPSGYVPYLTFPVFPIAFAMLTGVSAMCRWTVSRRILWKIWWWDMRVKRLWKLCIKRLCAFVVDWCGNYWFDYFV